ncbi:hypothetical protein AVEN_16557-1 [Araneus ventricosus]|uniref:Uncharacterized protein n=1 Tax=Araneus ventricosus TaxID=182803 RepID=A0A4Y2N000_ARAVE|nr:hypothetical protein AVEN_16557-1 [Araneus ventricosus]
MLHTTQIRLFHAKTGRQCENLLRIGAVWSGRLSRSFTIDALHSTQITCRYSTSFHIFNPSISAGHSRPLHSTQIPPLPVIPIPAFSDFLCEAQKPRFPPLLPTPAAFMAR